GWRSRSTPAPRTAGYALRRAAWVRRELREAEGRAARPQSGPAARSRLVGPHPGCRRPRGHGWLRSRAAARPSGGPGRLAEVAQRTPPRAARAGRRTGLPAPDGARAAGLPAAAQPPLRVGHPAVGVVLAQSATAPEGAA